LKWVILYQFVIDRPILGQWLVQIGRTIGFSLGLFVGYTVITKPAPELAKYEITYQLAGVLLLVGSTITFIGILLIFIILILV
jgi:hypothetical protein